LDTAQIQRRTFVRYVEHHPLLGSTSDRALELAGDAKIPLPALVVADRQTAGRGRGSNRWWSAEGALTFSLLLDSQPERLPHDRWPQLSLAAGVAACDALSELAPGRFGLKWPNDVHAAGRKIAGILVEAPNVPATRPIVVGVGVNVNNSWAAAPADLQGIGTSLFDLTGGMLDRGETLCRLLTALEHRLEQLAAGGGELPDAWQSLCVLRGRQVGVETAGRKITGECLGIASDGGLLLRDANGRAQRFYGGVVRSIR